MQALSVHHATGAVVRHQAAACSQLATARRASRKRAMGVPQAGLFGLNFGTASSTDIKTRKQEVRLTRL